jgi:RNA recognition motif-containing protein
VLDVVAHNNLRMRGQAFVSFPSPEIAKKAMKDVQRFPLYSKPMVRVFFGSIIFGRQKRNANDFSSSKYHLRGHALMR